MYKKKYIATSSAPKAIGPYSQAIEIDNLIFTSGQIPLCPKSGELISEDFELQTEQCIKNLQSILANKELTLEHILKLTVFIVDLSKFDIVNKVFLKFFKGIPPARSVVEVSRLPKNAQIEIEGICYYEK